MLRFFSLLFFFFFNDTATTEIYTLSLHDALPISDGDRHAVPDADPDGGSAPDVQVHREERVRAERDRKSTRLNSSHLVISYAVFCLKKKKKHKERPSAPGTRPHHAATSRPAPTRR